MAVGRVAEIVVDLLFDLRQRSAQLLHHAAHGLAVGDAAVEVLHPHVQRLRRGATPHLVDAARQTLHTVGQLGLVKLTVFQRCVEIQDAGGHFHGQRRRRGLARRHRLRRGGQQRLGQHLAGREQLLQRLTDQRKLLAQVADAVLLTAGHGRPGIPGRRHTFARQRQLRRIETAEARGFVVGRALVLQAPDAAHRLQARRTGGGGGRLGVAAEKQQVLRQAVGQFGLAAHAGTQLRQQARRDALGEDIGTQQAGGLGLKHGGGHLPQRGDLGRAHGTRAGAQVGAEVAHALQRWAARLAHQRQHLGLHRAARLVVGGTRFGAGVGRQVQPLPVDLPQVGRMHTIRTRQRLHRTVLREQHHRRHRLARQQPRQVVQQRKGHTLDEFDRRHIDERRLGDQTLHRRLAGTQHVGHGGQAHQFQRTHALVQLRARAAQHGRIDRIDVAAAQRLGILQITPQRLVRGFQRPAQLDMHPGQRAEVVTRQALQAGGLGVQDVLHR